MTARLELRRSGGEVQGSTLIDDDDLAWLSRWRWQDCGGYAIRYEWHQGRTHCIRMSREILGLPRFSRTLWADHMNGDKLDNRRENLRPVDSSGNAQNRRRTRGPSPQPGVHWLSRLHRWCVVITFGGKRVYLGRFIREADAVATARQFRATHLPFSQEARELPRAAEPAEPAS